MDIAVKILQAEFALPGNKSQRQRQRRFELRLVVETLSGELEKSAWIWLDSAGKLAASIPPLAFHFDKPSSDASDLDEFSLLFVLHKTSGSDGAFEIGRAFVPVRPNTKTPVVRRTAILSRRLEEAVVNLYVGRICFEVSHVVRRKADSLSSIPQSRWLDLNLTRKHLPFLVELPVPLQEKQGPVRPLSKPPLTLTEQGLMQQEKENSSQATHPIDTGLVFVIFHSWASTSGENIAQFNYQPVACISHEQTIPNNLPSCSWNHTNSSAGVSLKTVSSISILKSVCLKVHDPTSTACLYVLQEGNNTVVFSGKEFVGNLSPFEHHHRGWVSGHDKPKTISDPDFLTGSHLVASAIYLPPASHYYRYEGLEISLQRFELTINQSYQPALVAFRVMRNHSNASLGMQSSAPSLWNDSNTLGEKGIPNFKLSLLRYSSVDQTYGKAYFFFSRDSNWLDIFSDEGDLCLQLFVHVIDPVSLAPWWQKEPSYSKVLALDNTTITALLSDKGLNGVLWQPATSQLDPVKHVDVVLRWKSKQLHFLGQDIDYYHMPRLDQDTVDSPITEQQKLSTPLPGFKAASAVGSHFTAGKVPPSNQPLPDATLLPIATPIKAMSSTNNADDALVTEYKAAIRQYGEDISRQKEENLQLSRINRMLVEELEHLQVAVKDHSAHHYQFQPHTRRQLEALPKVDLVEAVESIQERLLQERAQKEIYQHKVQVLQNELIEKNDVKLQLIELQQAHTAQQKLIHELQRKGEKYRKCYETCVHQEHLIHRLEAALGQHPHGKSSPKQQLDPYPHVLHAHHDSEQPKPAAHSHTEPQTQTNNREKNTKDRARMTHDFHLTNSHNQPSSHPLPLQRERALHDMPLYQKLCEQEDRATRLAEENQQLCEKLNTIWGLLDSSINRQAPKPTGQKHSLQSTAKEETTRIISF